MTNFTTGQDVVVESDDLLDGEAFIVPVDEEQAFSDENLYVNLRGRDAFGAEVALVSRDDVVTLTEVFDTIKALRSGDEIQRLVRDAMAEANVESRRKA